ncbi:MAG: hypothetical protein HY901_31820 [Deltaproteobacteria bacterium]|nr:hypothetical protein [Deltaproteobacteria bacterium]
MPSDHGVSRVTTHAKAIVKVARDLGRLPGLAEADRLGLQVCVEILGEALETLGLHAKLSTSQGEHLKAAASELIRCADTLALDPTPVQIADWWKVLEPSVRAFARVVRELPHQ